MEAISVVRHDDDCPIRGQACEIRLGGKVAVGAQVAQAKFIRNVCRYLAVRNMTKKYNKNALPCVRCVFLVLAWCFRPF